MMNESDRSQRIFSKAVALRALVVFLVTLAVLTVVVVLLYRSQGADHMNRIKRESLEVLTLQHAAIREALVAVTGELLFLAEQNELLDYLSTGEKRWLEGIANEYLVLATQSRIYDQIRFIDATGMEKVRVNFNDGSPTVVPQEELQPKAQRYYFLQSYSLDRGEIYMSPLDLNIEQGRIEEPWKPMIRYATPVFDRTGEKRGIVILNYLAENVLALLEQPSAASVAGSLLTNGDGCWLKGLDPSHEWEFMFQGEGAMTTVGNVFPGLWRQVCSADSGQFRTTDGLFTFLTVQPSEASTRTSVMEEQNHVFGIEPEPWKLISYVSADVLRAMYSPIRWTWGIIYGLASIFAAMGSWFFARFRTAQIQYQHCIQYLAKYDSLTGACNRHFFEQSISDEEARARRYNHSISFLMIDVTRLKQINDTHGHQVGDEVLKEVTALLRNQVRQIDVVIRYGGDEFLIMFPETPGEADAARDRILADVDRRNRESLVFDFPVILAIGSAHWEPQSSESIESTLAVADEQMYEIKKRQHAALDDGV